MPLERLQKIIAAAGIASRRKAEELITGGLVSVNGQVVTELGTKADPATDRIKVAGKPLQGPERHVYLLLHKPKGYVTTVNDPEKRPTVMDLVRVVGARLYPVGRLDYLSEGLLLLTNDGALAQKLTHASSHVPKTYLVKISGKPTEDEIEKLRGGVFLPAETKPLKTREGTEQRRRSEAVRTGPVRIELLRDAANPWYEITLIEGRNRQIRRMFDQIDHHVEKIKRVRYGPLQLDVEVGQFRHLTSSEVAQLKSPMQGLKPARKPERRPPQFKTAAQGSNSGPGPERRPERFKAPVQGSRPGRKPERRPTQFETAAPGSNSGRGPERRPERFKAPVQGERPGGKPERRPPRFARADQRSKPGRKPERSTPELTANRGQDKKVSRPPRKQETGSSHPAKRRRNGAPAKRQGQNKRGR